MAGFYREFLNEIKLGIQERRSSSWFHSKIETRNGMQTSYVQLNYDLANFIDWLERKADEEEADVKHGSILFMIGGE